MTTKYLRKTLLAAAVLSTLPVVASAFDYNYVEGGFLHRRNDFSSDNGFRIGGSFNVAPPVAVFGEYGNTNHYDSFSVGGLYHTPINNALDLNLGASLEHASVPHDSDTGFGLRGGVRWNVVPGQWELNPELRYVNILNHDGISARVAALYHVNPNLDVQAGVQAGDEDRAEVGVRYNFGHR